MKKRRPRLTPAGPALRIDEVGGSVPWGGAMRPVVHGVGDDMNLSRPPHRGRRGILQRLRSFLWLD
jgi:hypothetical protein